MPNPFDEILASVSRAEKSGQTDEDEAHAQMAKELGHKVIDLINEYTGARKLTTFQAEQTLAAVIGCTIKNCRTAGPVSGMLVAVQLCQTIMELAVEES